jgi:hypothetical protein
VAGGQWPVAGKEVAGDQWPVAGKNEPRATSNYQPVTSHETQATYKTESDKICGLTIKGDKYDKELSGLGSMEGSNEISGNDLSDFQQFPERGEILSNRPNSQGGDFGSIEHSRGAGKDVYKGISLSSVSSERIIGGIRNPDNSGGEIWLPGGIEDGPDNRTNTENGKNPKRSDSFSSTSHDPLTTSHFYLINTNEIAIQLSGTPGDVIDVILAARPKRVIMLDRLFENNDQLKTNTYLQFKDAGVDFRTV